MKQTKIVATIGPASLDPKVLSDMIAAGLNVARMNFSHSEHSWHEDAIARVRSAAVQQGKPVAILGDLQGPRIRTLVEGEVEISSDEAVILHEDGAAPDDHEKKIGVDQKGIIEQLKSEQRVLIEDGKMSLEIISVNGAEARARVVDGGTVKNHKGMNFPGANLRLSAMTEKDIADLEFLLSQNVEFIALSFVGSAADIRALRDKMRTLAPDKIWYPKIVAKIERHEAMERLDEIIEETDAVMVARGDLGIEMGESRVVIFQKDIIRRSMHAVKPVIVATQMLESMMENPRPTRAEVSDISNAVIDHTDATMLSGETAGGKHPLACVATMADIICRTEESPLDDIRSELQEMSIQTKYADMLRGVYALAHSSNSKAIAATSSTGYTAALLSHFRPDQKILIATENPFVYRQMAILWGVRPFLFEDVADGGDNHSLESALMEKLLVRAAEDNILSVGDEVVTVVNESAAMRKIEKRDEK